MPVDKQLNGLVYEPRLRSHPIQAVKPSWHKLYNTDIGDLDHGDHVAASRPELAQADGHDDACDAVHELARLLIWATIRLA